MSRGSVLVDGCSTYVSILQVHSSPCLSSDMTIDAFYVSEATDHVMSRMHKGSWSTCYLHRLSYTIHEQDLSQKFLIIRAYNNFIDR